MSRYFHGGIAGLQVGDVLTPSAPHVDDGCPICEARKQGRVCTVGEYKRWLRPFGARALPVLRALAGAEDWEPVDPPSAKRAVYITTSLAYATWYAARSRGDLYEVTPVGLAEPSPEDHFPSWTCEQARVTRVVRLTRTERRRIAHAWRKADRRVDRQRVARAQVSSILLAEGASS